MLYPHITYLSNTRCPFLCAVRRYCRCSFAYHTAQARARKVLLPPSRPGSLDPKVIPQRQKQQKDQNRRQDLVEQAEVNDSIGNVWAEAERVDRSSCPAPAPVCQRDRPGPRPACYQRQSPATADRVRSANNRAASLKRVFAIDIETCRQCGGKRRVIASIEEPTVIERILDHLGHTVETVDPAHPSQAPPKGDRLI